MSPIYDRRYYYNNRGNRIREYKDDDTYYYTYNTSNQLTSYENDNDLVTLSYDDNGNLVSKVVRDYETLNQTGGYTFTYDNFNRLVSYTDGSDTTTYSYYADNLRASKTDSNSNITAFVWNGQNLAYEKTGTDWKAYSYDPTGIAAVKTASEQKIYAKNPHSDVIGQISDTAGTLSGATDFTAFGELVSGNLSSFGYAGEYHDTESGYIYLRNRYYDPSIGRFITEDPAKDGTNWYVYCGNNPVMFYDPFGLAPRPYEPEKWNVSGIVEKTNCYAYALDFCGEVSYGNNRGMSIISDRNGDKLQPGTFMSSAKTFLRRIFFSNMGVNNAIHALSGALLDANGNDHVFRPATASNIEGENLEENEWVVYLVASSGESGDEYHWYRQNPDGTWSHKPGTSPVTNREYLGVSHYADGSTEHIYGNIITDPTQISGKVYDFYYDKKGNLTRQEEMNNYDIIVGAYVVGARS